ncbi:MAG: hypothetical protein A2X86_11295 [Bdellovibrionales bacterium GWA2_49_15]|nr:MAG: hypothetical protein A2X86_11295 [Bdellovibrionales bacterium GWA2_49_15]HAZ12664.1 hypothetical protein [Bdellovibrionales bacterium]
MKFSIIFIFIFFTSLQAQADHSFAASRSCEEYQRDLEQLERYILNLKLGTPAGETLSIDLQEALKRRNELAAKLSIIKGLIMLRQRYANFMIYLNNRPDPNVSSGTDRKVWDNISGYTRDGMYSDAMTGGVVMGLQDGQTLYDVTEPNYYISNTGLMDMGNMVAMESTFRTLLGDASSFEQLKVAPPSDANTPHPLVSTLIGRCGNAQTEAHISSFCGLLTGPDPAATQSKQLIDRFARAFYYAHMARAIEKDPALDPSSEVGKTPQQLAADRLLSDRAREALDEYHNILNATPISALSATRDGRRLQGIDVIGKQFEGSNTFMTKYNQIYDARLECLNRISLSGAGSATVSGWGRGPGADLNQRLAKMRGRNTCPLTTAQAQELTQAFQAMKASAAGDDPLILQQFKRMSVSRFISTGNMALQVHQDQLGEWLQNWKKVKARPQQATYGFYDDSNPVNYTDSKLTSTADDVRNALVSINNRAEVEAALREGRPVDPSKLITTDSINDDKTIFKLLLGQMIKYKNNFLPAELRSCPPASMNAGQLASMSEENLSRAVHQCISSLPPASETDSITLKERELEAKLAGIAKLIQSFETPTVVNYRVIQSVRKSLVNLAKMSCHEQISTVTCAVTPLGDEAQTITYLIGSSGRILSRVSPLDIVSDSSIPALRNSIAANCRVVDETFRPEGTTGAGPFSLLTSLPNLCSAHNSTAPVPPVQPVVASVDQPPAAVEGKISAPIAYTPSGEISASGSESKWAAPLVSTGRTSLPVFMSSTPFFSSYSPYSSSQFGLTGLYTPGMGQFQPFTGLFSPTGYGMTGLAMTGYSAGYATYLSH